MVSAVLESALLRTWSNVVLLSATPASCVMLWPPMFAVSRARAALWPHSFSLLGVRIPSAPLSRRGSCLEGTFLVPLVAGLLLDSVLKCWFSLLLPLDYSVHKSIIEFACHVSFSVIAFPHSIVKVGFVHY